MESALVPQRVLLVEDDDVDARLIRRFLRDQPLEICHVYTVEEAAAEVGAGTVQLVLMDLGLTATSGSETIAAASGWWKDVPVIVLTGQSPGAIAQDALNAGAQDFLEKSTIDTDRLVRTIRFAQLRWQAMEDLRESEHKFRNVFASAPLGISVADTNGVLLEVNEALCDMLGYTSDELRGSTELEITHPEDAERTEAVYRAARHQIPPVRRLRKRYVRKDGGVMEANVHLAEREGPHGLDKVYAIVEDITAVLEVRGKLATAERRGAVGLMASGIAHSIQKPVQEIDDCARFLRTALRAYDSSLRAADVLADAARTGRGLVAALAAWDDAVASADLTWLRSQAEEVVDRTLEDADRVMTTVAAMTELAEERPDTREDFDLNQAIVSAVAVCRGEWEDVATVSTELADDLPPVLAVPHLLQQVLVSAVVDASRAIAALVAGTPGMRGSLVVSTRSVAGWVEATVADSGLEPDDRRDESVARWVVEERHGGQIQWASYPDAGNLFVIRLPASWTVEIAEA